MIHFFTDPYEDELLYSAIGRYHYYTGNIDFKDTLEELFNKRTIVAGFEIGSNIEALANNLSDKYTADYIINKHTIFPFYSPFLPEKRKREIIKAIKFDGGSEIYTKIGIIAGSICNKEGIYYCPCCAREELEDYGEAYIHREHQLQGVFLCPRHGSKLKRYPFAKNDCSRIEYLKFNSRLLDLENLDASKDKNYDKLLKLSKAAYFLLKEDLTGICKEKVAEAYKNLLFERGLTTSSGRIKQRELYEEFTSFYGLQFLELMQSTIEYEDDFNWLTVATRNEKRTVHPIRQLLLINFLQSDISEFFKTINNKYNPFGKGPWPCLNRAAEHYRQKVVKNLCITDDYKTRVPVGTFTCSCGFVYSRKGPDKEERDKYKFGRIKSFDYTWENKLKALLSSRKYGVREISREMGCDAKTAIKYAQKLGLLASLDTQYKGEVKVKSKELCTAVDDIYKAAVINFIRDNKNYTRKQVRSSLKKEYIWLYRHDKAWLMTNLPESIPRGKRNQGKGYTADWNKRDIELLELIRKQRDKLLQGEVSVRITKSSIGEAIGQLAALEKNIKKLPKTEKYLMEITETVEQFRLRRCKKIIDKKLQMEEAIKMWELQREAGIRTEAFEKLKEKLENYIGMEEKHEKNGS